MLVPLNLLKNVLDLFGKLLIFILELIDIISKRKHAIVNIIKLHAELLLVILTLFDFLQNIFRFGHFFLFGLAVDHLLDNVLAQDGLNLLVVKSLGDSKQILVFLSKYFVLDVVFVIPLDVFLNDITYVWGTSQDLHPIDLSDHEALTIGLGKVAENGSDVKGAVECTDKGLIGIPNHELLPLVDFIADINLTKLNENDFVDVVQLFENHLVFEHLSWLKLLEDLHHEIAIVLVCPGVKWNDAIGSLLLSLFDLESVSEDAQKLSEKELLIELVLNVIWKLLKHFNLRRVIDGLVSIIRPSVVEVLLDLFFQSEVDWNVVIEVLDKSEELCKFVTFIELCIQLLELFQDCDKDAHNVGEDGNSKEKNEGAKESLDVTLRMEISESNGR